MEAAGHAAAGPRPDAPEGLTFEAAPVTAEAATSGPFRASLAVSALLHAGVLALAMQLAPAALPPLARVIPVSLVSLPGGGGGPAGPDVGPPPGEPAPAAAAPEPARVASKPVPPPRPAAKRVVRPAPKAAEPPPVTTAAVAATSGADAAGTSGTPAGGGGTRAGGGDGSGGDGSGGARVAYGQNPLPPYPLVARRMGMEGVVLLEVVVAPDGRPADVRIARSSGHAMLDDSAVRTVRERWRFVPARRDGAAVESRVTVPIRFRLSGVETTG